MNVPVLRLLPLLLVAVSPASSAETPAVAAAHTWRETHERQILGQLADLLAIPNVSSDLPNIRRNATRIAAMLRERGIETRLLEIPGAAPVVYGEIASEGAKRTIAFYAHYDGQPVDPSRWTGGDPFRPVLRSAKLEAGGKDLELPGPGGRLDPEARLYARSASDDKAPIVAILAAYDALRARGITPTSNVKLFFEGEEEAGSTHLERIVAAHPDEVRADLWLICDGPVDQSGRPQVYFGARGIVGLELTVYGPRRELHSGHYGGWAPNPAMMLARLLATMRDDEGRVLIDGFYDGIEPLGDTERRALAEAPENDASLMRELGIARAEGGGKRLVEIINGPSLNVRGISSGSVGAAARNAIPETATASLDIRLVRGMDHRTIVERVIAHIRKQGFHVVDSDPDDATRLAHPRIVKVVADRGYNAARTSMDLEISRRVLGAVESARGAVVRMPTLGGSVPLYIFTDLLKTPAIGVPIVNYDNNQHSANENLRLQNLWDGIEVIAALMGME